MEQEQIRMIKFLDGDLTGPELEKLKLELGVNSQTREDLDLLRQIDSFLASEDKLRFRQNLVEVRQQYASQSNLRRLSSRPVLLLAAACILLAVLSSLFLLFRKSSGTEELFAQYYKPYPAAQTTRSGFMESGALFNAIRLYEKKDFSPAYESFRILLEKEPSQITARFYLAFCALETNRTDEAVRLFRELASEKASAYAMHARWYLALTYLRNKQDAEARKELESIPPTDTLYYDLAREVLGKLP